MDSFTDYYAILGVDTNASAEVIKAAFKKLALQYHPDVYKGADAHERMRVLLLAYQTLSDPTERRSYDLRHAEHVAGDASRYVHTPPKPTTSYNPKGPVTPNARRDRKRAYAFPDLKDGSPAQITLADVSYSLAATDAQCLLHEGLLRGVANVGGEYIDPDALRRKPGDTRYYCHRCHHRWAPPTERGPWVDTSCPSCRASDWSEYLLLRCIHCCAVFESEQIRYEIGSYNYGDGTLCPPYELFPLCPYCGTAGWCPAEDARVSLLRAQAARRAATMRWVWIAGAVVAFALVIMFFVLFR